MLTRTHRNLRAVRACCTYLGHRAACPREPTSFTCTVRVPASAVPYVPRTVWRTPGKDRTAGQLAPGLCVHVPAPLHVPYNLTPGKERTVDGVPTSLCDLGYCDVGLDDNWQQCSATRGGLQFHAEN